MNRKFNWSLLILATFVSSGSAAVTSRDWKTPGDGLLTYDTVNKREWLDLTETQLFKFPGTTLEDRYQSVMAELAPAGLFEGFGVARQNDVIALAMSAGIDPNSFDGSDAENGIPTRALIELLSSTYSDIGSSQSLASTGFLNEFGGTDRKLGTVFVVIDGRTGLLRGGGTFFINRQEQESSGVWLYRQIPEPTAGIIITSVALMFFAMRRKF